MRNPLFLNLILIFIPTILWGQNDRTKGILWSSKNGIEYQIKAGFNLGGISPISMPVEIRSIKSYDPTLLISIESSSTKWFTDKWGLEIGLKLENKGMETDAKVKNYNMEMVEKDQGAMKGAWTGYVVTKIHNSYITIPALANYKLSNKWRIKGGAFISYLLNGNFNGYVYDGYLRNGDPTGEKINVTEATYDFSENLRKLSWGLQFGGQWKAFNHLNIYADMTWGLNDIFDKNFNVIRFNMYPIYLNLGFGYDF